MIPCVTLNAVKWKAQVCSFSGCVPLMLEGNRCGKHRVSDAEVVLIDGVQSPVTKRGSKM